MDDFYERIYYECGVRRPYKDEQDWELCAGDCNHTNDYIEFYNSYSDEMDRWQKYLLINMIIQGIEDLMDENQETLFINQLWNKTKEILLKDKHEGVIIYWSCIDEALDDCWNITSKMRELL